MSKAGFWRVPSAIVAAALLLLFASAGPAQTVADGPGVTVDTGNAVLMHRTPIRYPSEALSKRIEGTIVAQATLDSAGNVSELRVISGPGQLRRAVLQAVLDWHFAHEGAGSTRQVSVSFKSPNVVTGQPGAAGVLGGMPAKPAGPVLAPAARTGVPSLPSMNFPRVKSITVEGLPDEARNELLATLPLREGDAPSIETLSKMGLVVKQFDEHLSMSIMGRPEGTEIRIATPAAITAAGARVDVVASSSSIPAADGVSRINVAGDKQAMQLEQQVAPAYPPLAKQARIQGVVKLRAVISGEGKVSNLTVGSGHPLLVQSAIDAVKQWVYKPTMLNGKPVEVITDIDVNFSLAQ